MTPQHWLSSRRWLVVLSKERMRVTCPSLRSKYMYKRRIANTFVHTIVFVFPPLGRSTGMHNRLSRIASFPRGLLDSKGPDFYIPLSSYPYSSAIFFSALPVILCIDLSCEWPVCQPLPAACQAYMTCLTLEASFLVWSSDSCMCEAPGLLDHYAPAVSGRTDIANEINSCNKDKEKLHMLARFHINHFCTFVSGCLLIQNLYIIIYSIMNSQAKQRSHPPSFRSCF